MFKVKNFTGPHFETEIVYDLNIFLNSNLPRIVLNQIFVEFSNAVRNILIVYSKTQIHTDR